MAVSAVRVVRFSVLLCVAMCGCNKKPESNGASREAAVDSRTEIINPGFESGVLSPWVSYLDANPSLTSSNRHSGKFSLAESGIGSVYEDVSGLETGRTYTISAWVAAAPDTTTTASIGVYNPTTGVASFSGQLTAEHDWQLLKYPIILDKGTTLRIHLYHPSAGRFTGRCAP